MGLFGLFDKKFCDICGDKIGLLGNRKLEDGNLCKNCAAKLSPWFSERRHSTVQEIRAQLDYRERNKAAVAAFHTTRSIGSYYCLLLDEGARKFIVTRAKDIADENPDVLDYSQAIGCELEINENKTELKENKDGKSVSYDPPRYEYSYMFYATIKVTHPYFDEMRFALNSGYVRTGERCMSGSTTGWRISSTDLRSTQGANEYQEYVRLGNEIREAVEAMHAPAPAMDAATIAAAELQAAQLKAQMEAAGIDMEAYRAAHKALENGDPGPLQAIMETMKSLSAVPAGAAAAAGAVGAAAGAAAGATGAAAGGAAEEAAGAAAGGAAGSEAANTPANAGASLVKCPWCGKMTPPGAPCGYCSGPLDG